MATSAVSKNFNLHLISPKTTNDHRLHELKPTIRRNHDPHHDRPFLWRLYPSYNPPTPPRSPLPRGLSTAIEPVSYTSQNSSSPDKMKTYIIIGQVHLRNPSATPIPTRILQIERSHAVPPTQDTAQIPDHAAIYRIEFHIDVRFKNGVRIEVVFSGSGGGL